MMILAAIQPLRLNDRDIGHTKHASQLQSVDSPFLVSSLRTAIKLSLHFGYFLPWYF